MFPRATFCFALYIVILCPREEGGECPGDGGKCVSGEELGRPGPSAAASSRARPAARRPRPGAASAPPGRRPAPPRRRPGRRTWSTVFLPGRAAGALTYLVSVVAKIVFHGESILGCLWAPGGTPGGTPGAAPGAAQRGLAGPGPPLPGAGVSAGLRIAADPGPACLRPGPAGSSRVWGPALTRWSGGGGWPGGC